MKQPDPPYYDEREIGPYPQVPPILYQLRPPPKYHSNLFDTTVPSDPTSPVYFDPFHRRQKDEPLPEYFELWSVQAPEIEPHYSPAFMFGSLGVAAGLAYALWCVCQYLDPHPERRATNVFQNSLYVNRAL
jgi:hypothetical protein